MTTLSAHRKLTAGALALAITALLNGCTQADRVVYLGSETTKTIRLRETIKGAKVWYKDSSGVSVPGIADLLEGGYYRNDLSK